MNRPADGWQQTFDEPLELPDGRKLRTLADAIAWMAKEIPKSERGMKQVQAAAHCVTEAAENWRPNDLRAHRHDAGHQRHVVKEFTSRETTHWGKRKLKRDE
jgi:hypothetical protein